MLIRCKYKFYKSNTVKFLIRKFIIVLYNIKIALTNLDIYKYRLLVTRQKHYRRCFV